MHIAGKVDLLPEAERARLIAETKGQRLELTGLFALADEIAASLQKQGHLLARAVVPPQDITGGVVTRS